MSALLDAALTEPKLPASMQRQFTEPAQPTLQERLLSKLAEVQSGLDECARLAASLDDYASYTGTVDEIGAAQERVGDAIAFTKAGPHDTWSDATLREIAMAKGGRS